MPEQPVVVREIRWKELFPWLLLARTLRLALGLRVLFLATVGAVLFALWIGFIGNAFFDESDDAQVVDWKEEDAVNLWEARLKIPSRLPLEPQISIPSIWAPIPLTPPNSNKRSIHRPKAKSRNLPALFHYKTITDYTLREFNPPWSIFHRYSLAYTGNAPGRIILSLGRQQHTQSWLQLVRPIERLLTTKLTLASAGYLFLSFSGSLLIWSLFGGAIMRLVALDLTRKESLGVIASLRQTATKLLSYVAAPLLPLCGILLVALPILLLGFMAKWIFFAELVGFWQPVSLAFGFLLTLLALGFALGWPLMFATISVERTDAFDALSRSYAYAYQRPFHLLFYIFVVVLLGTVGVIVLAIFLSLLTHFVDLSLLWGGGDAAVKTLQDTSGQHFWKLVMLQLYMAFPIGFLWSASVGVYLLLRKNIDSVELDEIALEEETTHSLPTLTRPASGIPQVQKAANSNASDETTSKSSSPEKPDKTE